MPRFKPIDRRTMLRGMLAGGAVALALPRLESMLNGNGTAYADATDLPQRFGVWFFGNGVRREHWIPQGTGAEWTAGAELEPLVKAGLKPHVSVISGLAIKTPQHAHHSGMTGITTGAPFKKLGDVRDTIATTVSAPSIDMVAAKTLAGSTPFRSLELGVCKFTGTDEGTTFQYLSMNGPNDPNPPEYSAENLFKRLFGLSPTDPHFARVTRARTSVLDAVSSQIKSLQGKVSSFDRGRLEQHYESVRGIEKTLMTLGTSSCATPEKPVNPKEVSGREPIAEKNKLMSDLLALALACDLTRVFSYCFEVCGAGTYFWQTNANEGMHGMCHAGTNDLVHDAVVFTMEQCAYTLSKLAGLTEGDGPLLRNCSILVTSEHSEGDTHSQDEFPILLAGGGGGRLKSGMHYRSTTKENTSKALLTALRGAGVQLSEFGSEQGRVTEGIGALEA